MAKCSKNKLKQNFMGGKQPFKELERDQKEDNIIQENEAIKGRIIRDIRDLLEQGKEDYYKPVIISEMKAMEMEIKQYQLKNIIIKADHITKDFKNDLEKSDIWKNQLTIAFNFISSKDSTSHPVHFSKLY